MKYVFCMAHAGRNNKHRSVVIGESARSLLLRLFPGQGLFPPCHHVCKHYYRTVPPLLGWTWKPFTHFPTYFLNMFQSSFLYSFIYISPTIFVYVFLYIYMYVCLYMFLCIFLYMFLYVFTCMFLYVFLYMFLYIFLYIRLSISFPGCISYIFRRRRIQK